MALADVKSHFEKILKVGRGEIGKLSGLGDDVLLDLEMGGPKFVTAIRVGAEPILLANNFPKKANQRKYWDEAVVETVNEVKSTLKCGRVLKTWTNTTSKRGIYLVPSSRRKSTILVRFLKDATGLVANDSAVQAVASGFREIVYDKWVDIVKRELPGLFSALPKAVVMPDYKGKGRPKSIKTQIGQKTNVSHQEGTTVAELALKQLRKSTPNVVTNLDIDVLNILDYAEASMGIEWGRTSKQTKKGGFIFENQVITKLEKNTKGSKEKGDTKGVLTKFENAAKEYIRKSLMNKNSPLYGIDQKASRTIREQVTEGTISNLVDEIVRPLTKAGRPDMRFKVNKTAKQFKPEKRQPKAAKKQRNVKAAAVAGSIALTGKLVRGRPEKEKRKGTDNILRLQSIINKRLPAEVRRNMGKPALTNRSGTFSNSPEIVKMRRSPKGLTADYTYLKTGGGTPPRSNQPGVYQTFENSGRWPSGYNPKDLIKKSIRNLALQYTEEKFVQLRRR